MFGVGQRNKDSHMAKVSIFSSERVAATRKTGASGDAQ